MDCIDGESINNSTASSVGTLYFSSSIHFELSNISSLSIFNNHFTIVYQSCDGYTLSCSSSVDMFLYLSYMNPNGFV